MGAADEIELLTDALRILQERLPAGWTVEQRAGQGAGDARGDALFAFGTQSGMSSGTVLVEAKADFAPVDVERLLGGLSRRLREAAGGRPILLVSEFLSPRSRELLAHEDISYLDLTGNVRLVMQSPPVFIETTGADRRPRATSVKRSVPGLSGARAWRVIRFLAEVEPRYGVKDIEEATQISRGWISRVLDSLSDEALIQREPRGPVERVDWPALLRARGRVVDLFGANTTRRYVARRGTTATLQAAMELPPDLRPVVTGSFAAVRLAPVAAPALLALYLQPVLRPAGAAGTFDWAAQELDLLDAEGGGGSDVVLLRPPNPFTLQETRTVGGLTTVNLPQLVVDCLGGTGRMPAEGEALLEWMQENPTEWRFGSLEEYLEKRQP